MLKEQIDKIFQKEKNIEKKKAKLDKKLEKIFEKKFAVAFELYGEFLKSNGL